MAILWSGVVYEGGISGTTTVYTGPEHYRRIASGEKFAVQARVTQVSGTSPTVAIVLEHSNEGVAAAAWVTKSTPVPATAVTANQANFLQGQDAGTTPGMANMRLAITLGGTTPNAYVEVWLTVRSND